MEKLYRRKIEVNRASGKCDGHFKDYPIVPAAVMVKWLIHLLEDEVGRTLSDYSLSRMKCKREVLPDCKVDLTLRTARRGWLGEVSMDDQCCLSVEFVENENNV